MMIAMANPFLLGESLPLNTHRISMSFCIATDSKHINVVLAPTYLWRQMIVQERSLPDVMFSSHHVDHVDHVADSPGQVYCRHETKVALVEGYIEGRRLNHIHCGPIVFKA